MPFWSVKPSTSWPAAKLRADRDRRAGEVDVVEIGDRQAAGSIAVAAWFSV